MVLVITKCTFACLFSDAAYSLFNKKSQFFSLNSSNALLQFILEVGAQFRKGEEITKGRELGKCKNRALKQIAKFIK